MRAALTVKSARVALMLRLTLAGLAAAASLAGAPPAAALDRIYAVSALPPSTIFGRHFLAFVETVNRRGAGVVRIEMLTDPDAVPAASRPQAVRDGAVGMVFAPVSDFAALVPEANAIAASEIKAVELRANGGMALIDHIHRVRMNVHLLGMLNSGARLHLYLRAAPRLADGFPELGGARIGGAATYGAFLAALGGKPVPTAFAQLRAALEAGSVDGIIWPRIGLRELFADERLKYRIDPGFAQVATVTVVNLQTWQRLSDGARAILTRTMIEQERKSYTALRVATEKEDEALDDRGLRAIVLRGAARERYIEASTRAAWDRLKARDATYYPQLERLFYRR